eukprot:gb/GECH01013712.1/.p1 GENE.gb/GECH01013712.1/~~gb/GECH01013712.1/.p1  ORF type:complete len:1061 (+),score=152.47 gb/GECH01013712.1/:1-3183(+)
MNSELQDIERLCEKVFSSQSQEERTSAEQQLQSEFGWLESMGKLQSIFTSTQNSYCLFYVSSTMTKLITNNWNSLETQQTLELRTMVFNFLGENGPDLPTFVLNRVIRLLCRLTKLGWFQDESHKELTDRVINMFVKTDIPGLIGVGLSILTSLVQEMNSISGLSTITQNRKVAVSFRDSCLKQVFKGAVSLLEKLCQELPNSNVKLCNAALDVVLVCLRYDFVGVFPDESADDIGRCTAQVPASWRSEFEEGNPLELYFELYNRLPKDQSSKAIECLVMLCSIRRSLFSSETERAKFLSHLLKGIEGLLQSRDGLSEQDNYHQFCRLLARLKSNFQLSEIVRCDNYNTFIDLAADFTRVSFQMWQGTDNSVYYLLNMWARLVTSLPYLKGDKPALLDNYIPKLATTYIESRLDLARGVIANDAMENPLEDEEKLTAHLESLPKLVHFDYEKIAPTLVDSIQHLMSRYEQMMSSSPTDMEIYVIESQLAWLLYLSGAVIGARPHSTSSSDANDAIDGEITGRIFQVLTLLEKRIENNPELMEGETLQRLESSVIYFLQHFKRVYVGESASTTKELYAHLENLFGISDNLQTLNLMVQKVGMNLKMWGKSPRIIQETLDFFFDLSSGFSSAKLMLKLDSIRFILQNHSRENFPFLAQMANVKHRTKFYCTICKLLFNESYSEQKFLQFMTPLEQTCQQLEQIDNPQEFRTRQVKEALIGLMRDLRGVCLACSNRRTYNFFFEWIFSNHTPLLLRVAEVWYDDYEVINPLLKFVAEFVLNRGQRITFDSSSPNGILLFKETSKIICAFGESIQNITVEKDPYKELYKQIWVCMSILSRAMGGNYCNFGVFALYGDPALSNAINAIVNMVTIIPKDQLMSFPKVKKTFFAMLEILLQNHMTQLIQYDTNIFLYLIEMLETGIRSNDVPLSSQSCAALDHFCTFYFTKGQKNHEDYLRIQRHLEQDSQLLERILSSLFNMIIYEKLSNQWSISRPMLSLIVINSNYFEQLKQSTIMSFDESKQEKATQAFDRLMDKVEMNLEPRNRDRFTGNLSQFRQIMRNLV